MKVNVLYFAISREVVGKSQEELQLEDGATTHKLLEQLLGAYPGLQSVMKACVFAVNQEYVAPSQALTLKDGDEVAIIPPLSGG
jgi:molybdopterin converting factor subunit 1